MASLQFLHSFFLVFFLRSGWPTDDYFTPMDVWLTACYLTVFISVFEYCTVIYLTKRAVWEELLDQRRKIDVLKIDVLKRTYPQDVSKLYFSAIFLNLKVSSHC